MKTKGVIEDLKLKKSFKKRHTKKKNRKEKRMIIKK